jgi:hypothetical protein
MFLHRLLIAIFVGFAPAHYHQGMCVPGVEGVSLFATLYECEFPDDALLDCCGVSVERLGRRERHSKYLRLLRECACGTGLAAPGKMLPLEWAVSWNTCGDGAGASQHGYCRGPPVVDRGSFGHYQSGDPGGEMTAEAHYESTLKIVSKEAEPC